jgi:hypothetical protein
MTECGFPASGNIFVTGSGMKGPFSKNGNIFRHVGKTTKNSEK